MWILLDFLAYIFFLVVKDVLERMYAEYDHVMEESSKSSHGNDAAPGYQSDLETLSKYLEMYDQEYMLKVKDDDVICMTSYILMTLLNRNRSNR